MDLITITVSYNTRQLLAECLDSVLAAYSLSGLTGEIWVVDNASMDGSPEMVREQFPSTRLIASNKNLGFAAGNNLALKEIGLGLEKKARHILFLNPDTVVQGDALGAMVRFLDATPLTGVVGAQLVHGDGSFQHSAFHFPGLAQLFLDLFPVHHRLLDSRLNGRYPRHFYQEECPFKIDHPLGAALMVRSETLAQVGSFDDRYFMYCEEVDLCRRIKAAGWAIQCIPEAKITHYAGQSTRQLRTDMFLALWRSRFLMYSRFESPAFLWAARKLVRFGLKRNAKMAKNQCMKGEITSDELAGYLSALEEVASL